MKRLVALLLCFGMSSASWAADFVLTSKDIAQGKSLTIDQVFNGFGCTGKNISPALSWANAPEGTKSFAITVYDPDAPTGSGWWHWVAFNIPATVTDLPKNAGDIKTNLMPESVVQSRTDFGTTGFGGACPPVGDKAHRYQFTVHALSVEKLDLDNQTPAAMVGYMINAHRLGAATLEAHFGR